jgi:hypothetical protein
VSKACSKSIKINKKCRWQRFQNVGDSQPGDVKGVDYTN